MMEVNRDLADFLRRARAAVDPARAGLPADNRIRRVPGLRREEVALLAGVSTDYYARLEQGRHITPSPAVISGIAAALDLDSAGLTHLEQLIGATSPPRSRRPPAAQRVRPGLHQLLDSLDAQPALILGRQSEILASNRMAHALFADFSRMPPQERKYARWILLDEHARELFVDWEAQARAAVESLRLDIGRDRGSREAEQLIAELTARSPDFQRWWTEHRVFQRTFGSKRLRHPIVGELTVQYESLALPGDPDQVLFIYTTEVGTSSRQAMDVLVSWAMETASPSRGA